MVGPGVGRANFPTASPRARRLTAATHVAAPMRCIRGRQQQASSAPGATTRPIADSAGMLRQREQAEREHGREVGQQQRGQRVVVASTCWLAQLVEEQRVVRADRHHQQQADQVQDAERDAGEREAAPASAAPRAAAACTPRAGAAASAATSPAAAPRASAPSSACPRPRAGSGGTGVELVADAEHVHAVDAAQGLLERGAAAHRRRVPRRLHQRQQRRGLAVACPAPAARRRCGATGVPASDAALIGAGRARALHVGDEGPEPLGVQRAAGGRRGQAARSVAASGSAARRRCCVAWLGSQRVIGFVAGELRPAAPARRAVRATASAPLQHGLEIGRPSPRPACARRRRATRRAARRRAPAPRPTPGSATTARRATGDRAATASTASCHAAPSAANAVARARQHLHQRRPSVRGGGAGRCRARRRARASGST